MTRIITINREFGSGGRELGKRLADALGIPCYDHEIIQMIARENGFDERYVANVSERSIEAAYPLTIGHRFAMPSMPVMDQPIRVAVAQRQIVENFAKQGDCVIVGRCADVILKEYHPLNIFVYADLDSKVARCQARAPEGENLTRRELERRIRQVERGRRQFREMYTESKWGRKESYDLCVNTSGLEIKALIPALVAYADCWFGQA
ncbi:MAG: cytidylate kinase-like family protein [Ruminococcaceae bacterium]|jgi:cytidylate kinase|nr:cytidylate kinase-like family protein [Oscillospiraceae bacterium]